MDELVSSPWNLAQRAAMISAVAPDATAGILVSGFAGPVRDEWLLRYRSMLSAGTPLRRIPLSISPDRLTAGLDLASTLKEGRVVVQRGILADADGGVILLSMAERISDYTAATIAATLDNKQIVVHRDGVSQTFASSIGVVAFDEALPPEESVALSLKDRLAMWVDLSGVSIHQIEEASFTQTQLESARSQWRAVKSSQENLQSLCVVASSLGVDSIRALLMADRISRIVAALDGRGDVCLTDLTEAIHLVLVPRATQVPQLESEAEHTQEEADPETQDFDSQPDPSESNAREDIADEVDESPDDDHEESQEASLEDVVLQSVVVDLPADLMARIEKSSRRERSANAGRSGEVSRSRRRGRPVGSEAGMPEAGKRLDLLASLRAAAPWQPLRRKEAFEFESRSSGRSQTGVAAENRGIIVKAEDLRVKRFLQRAETTTIFVVDASGSAALHRLAEAKGAVESLLADCYSRRDRVALIVFKGSSAELLLPPTRSLVRAKRAIIALPGGGGTPISAALDSARLLAEQVQREGATPSIVLLTDGKANICRDGSPGRENAMQEALDSAAEFAALGFRAIVVDTSPRPSEKAQKLAGKLDGYYLPLPTVDAKYLSGVIQDVLH